MTVDFTPLLFLSFLCLLDLLVRVSIAVARSNFEEDRVYLACIVHLGKLRQELKAGIDTKAMT